MLWPAIATIAALGSVCLLLVAVAMGVQLYRHEAGRS